MASLTTTLLGNGEEVCTFDEIMRCYYASSLHAHELYRERMKLPDDVRNAGLRPLQNTEALHCAHLVSFIRHMKLSPDLGRQFAPVGLDPVKFVFTVHNIPEFKRIHRVLKIEGLSLIHKIKTRPIIARRFLYGYEPSPYPLAPPEVDAATVQTAELSLAPRFA